MRVSGADSHITTWRFSDASGTVYVLNFRVCWWFGSTETDDYVYRLFKNIVGRNGNKGYGLPKRCLRADVFLHNLTQLINI